MSQQEIQLTRTSNAQKETMYIVIPEYSKRHYYMNYKFKYKGELKERLKTEAKIFSLLSRIVKFSLNWITVSNVQERARNSLPHFQ